MPESATRGSILVGVTVAAGEGRTNGCKAFDRGPRVVYDRHSPDCPSDTCEGCLPCPERHCGICRRVHAQGTCPACVGYVRDDLDQIRQMCGLPLNAERRQRGVASEAFMLAGPSANAEAWSNRALTAMFGRLDDAYLEDCRDERHPLWILGTWENVWRDHLEQPSDLKQTIDRASDYIDRHLHELAQAEEPDFPQFVDEVRGCRAHLQAVLHDQNQGDRANVGCFDCGGDLERLLTDTGFEDRWTCRRCHRRYTVAEYNFALRASLEEATTKKEAS